MDDVETSKREINALLQLAKHLEVKKMLVITRGEEKIITINDMVIEVIPIWRWLISN
jgi:predicted AAA+ superfamily ATPase